MSTQGQGCQFGFDFCRVTDNGLHWPLYDAATAKEKCDCQSDLLPMQARREDSKYQTLCGLQHETRTDKRERTYMSNMTRNPALTDVCCSRHRPAASQRRYGCKSTQLLLGLRRHDWSPWLRQRLTQLFRFRQRLLLRAHLLLFWQPASVWGCCGDVCSPSFGEWQASLISSFS